MKAWRLASGNVLEERELARATAFHLEAGGCITDDGTFIEPRTFVLLDAARKEKPATPAGVRTSAYELDVHFVRDGQLCSPGVYKVRLSMARPKIGGLVECAP